MSTSDMICFSHLRWGFVFQRPNHLISRAARRRRTFFVEEPLQDAADGRCTLEIKELEPSLSVCVPHVPARMSASERVRAQRSLLEGLLRERRIQPEVA